MTRRALSKSSRSSEHQKPIKRAPALYLLYNHIIMISADRGHPIRTLFHAESSSAFLWRDEGVNMTKLEDLSGHRFGHLVVIDRDFSKTKDTFWNCVCDCGRIKSIRAHMLKSGRTQSCGCCRKYDIFKETIGQQFGDMTAVEYVGRIINDDPTFLCKCMCGEMFELTRNNLINRRSRVKMSPFSEDHICRHFRGQSYTRLYHIWQAMKARCDLQSGHNYSDYGGRGITYCKEWEIYENFQKWAYKQGYSDNLTLERIDVNGNYCPDNCTWIPRKEQLNNTRRNIFLECNGEVHTLKQWSQI